MSKVVDALLDNAYQDSVLLQGNDGKGDVFSIPRDVDFIFHASDKEKAELVASFMNDSRYGDANYYQSDNFHCNKVVINMPTEQNIINSISGFMTCTAVIYDLEYDEWGCALQTNT